MYSVLCEYRLFARLSGHYVAQRALFIWCKVMKKNIKSTISGIYFLSFLYFFDISQYVNDYVCFVKLSSSSVWSFFTGEVAVLMASL